MGRLLLADGVVDLDRAEVLRGKSVHRLTPNERELLAYLGSRAGRDVGRDELHTRVWGHSAQVQSRAVDLTVHRLRRKVEQRAEQPRHLLTAAGGYRWVPPALGAPAPESTVVLVVGEISTPGDSGWLVACAELVRDHGVHLVDLAPDRVVLACPTADSAGDVARTLAARNAGLRIGMAAGPAECLVDPLSGRTLYGGVTLARAAHLARAARPGEVPAGPADATAGPAPTPTGPARLDRFVGRDAVLGELVAAVTAGSRALVLVGPAGAGKSRLAEELTARLGRIGWTVPLDPVDDVGDVVAGVVQVLGLPPAADPAGAAGAALSVRGPAVLVLDGAERVAGALGPLVARWVADAPELVVVVTSRERPALDGARVHALEGLSTADGIALLRARTPDPGDDDALARVVEAVDGLPLALELLAPRLRVVDADELATRNDPLLDVLAAPTGSDARHRSMRSALQASWDRLDPHERRVLVRATAFAGRFGLADAESVLASDAPGAPWFVDTLQSLCDRHLVQAERVDGARRFRLLATVRAFAEEHGELLGDAHLRHAETVGAPGQSTTSDAPPPAAMADLRLAARRGLREGWIQTAAAAAIAYGHASLAHGEPDGPIALLEAVAVAAPPDAATGDLLGDWLRGRAAYLRSQLLKRAGRGQEALAVVDEAIRCAASSGDPGLEPIFEMLRANIFKDALFDMTAAMASFDRAEALAGAAYPEVADNIRLNRATLYHAIGQFEAGLAEVQPLLRGGRSIVDSRAAALAGTLCAGLGHPSDGVPWLERAVELLAEHGESYGAANYRMLLAELLLSAGRESDAARVAEEAIAEMRAFGCVAWVVIGHTILAAVELARSDPQAAAARLADAAPWIARTRDTRPLGMVAALECEVRACLGDAAGSDRAGSEAHARFTATGDPASLGHVAVHRGMAALALGSPEVAAAQLAEAEAQSAALGPPPRHGLIRQIRRLRRALQRTPR